MSDPGAGPPRREHYVVLGLARVRSAWFRDLGRWATAAALPVDFVKCVSVEEVRARLGSGRAFSALLVDGSLPVLDRDLVDQARQHGCSVLAVDDGRIRRDWSDLGVSGVVAEPLDRATVLAALREHAVAVGRLAPDLGVATTTPTGWRGRLVAVTGAGGTGTSTLALAAAQGLGADPRHRGRVVLADLALDADQAMLHDTGDVVPGVQELVEAHRLGRPSPDEVRALTYAIDGTYRLLLGLRRHRDWAGLRPRAFEAALDGLRQAFTLVVADIDADLEGEDDCGSLDVEERNVLARTVTTGADLVVVSATPGVTGLHRLVRLLDALGRHGVPADRVLPVINRSPRGPRARAELAVALGELTRGLAGGAAGVASPLFLPEHRRVDPALRDGAGLPRPFPTALATAIEAAFERVGERRPAGPADPVAVTPGSLGAWPDD